MSIPGPPRGRRGLIAGTLRQRVEAMRTAEVDGSARVLLAFARDVILLVRDLARDRRVPVRSKVALLLAAAYLVLPIDLSPDPVPVVGQLDDLIAVLLAVRQLVVDAGYDVVYDLWRGSDPGLALLMTLAGVQE